MDFMQRANLDVLHMESAERMREAERFRRARQVRQEMAVDAAARKERRFFIFRMPFVRPREA